MTTPIIDHFEGFPTSSTPFKEERSWHSVEGARQPQHCRMGPAGVQMIMSEEDYSNVFQIEKLWFSKSSSPLDSVKACSFSWKIKTKMNKSLYFLSKIHAGNFMGQTRSHSSTCRCKPSISIHPDTNQKNFKQQ